MPDLDALLGRIGLDAAPPPTVAGLRAVHAAYVTALPYEALSAQLGEFAPLDLEAIAARVVAGRGGYCFELNGLLAWMLEALGFAVQRREAIVGTRDEDPTTAPQATNHLALVVAVDGERFLADAGLGEGPIEPLPLVAGRHHAPASSPLHWTLEPASDSDDGAWWVTQHPWGSVRTFHLTAPAVALDAFQPFHRQLSTDPLSSFVQTLVVQRTAADQITTLRARTLFVDGPGRRERRVLPDAAAFATTLRETFALDPDALGPQRIARLWALAGAQHDRHDAPGDPAAEPVPRNAVR